MLPAPPGQPLPPSAKRGPPAGEEDSGNTKRLHPVEERSTTLAFGALREIPDEFSEEEINEFVKRMTSGGVATQVNMLKAFRCASLYTHADKKGKYQGQPAEIVLPKLD